MLAPGVIESNLHIGDAPWPHLHRTCDRCGYHWLEHCLLPPQKADEAEG